MADRIWTVVRFPNGSWSYGGNPDSPDYEHCEVWQIAAYDAKEAVKKAQAKRRRQPRNAGVAGALPPECKPSHICAICKRPSHLGRCADASARDTATPGVPPSQAPGTYAPSREVVQQALELVDRIRDSHASWGGWSGIPQTCERISNMLRYGTPGVLAVDATKENDRA